MAITDTIDFTTRGSTEIRVEDDVLYVTLSGLLTGRDVRRAADETIRAVRAFDDEFPVVVDVSTYDPGGLDPVGPFRAAQAALAAHDVGDVFRVVGPRTGQTVVPAFRRGAAAAGYEAVHVESVAAAERLLRRDR